MLSAALRMWLSVQSSAFKLNTSSTSVLEIHPNIDPDPQIRDVFGNTRSWTSVHATTADAPFHTNGYDLVLMIESIGRVQHPTSLIADLTEIVKPGGIVLCTIRVEGGMLPPGTRPSDSTGLIHRPRRPEPFRHVFSFAGFDLVPESEEADFSNLPPGFFTAYQRQIRDLPPLLAYGSFFREGDEVPDIEQHIV